MAETLGNVVDTMSFLKRKIRFLEMSLSTISKKFKYNECDISSQWSAGVAAEMGGGQKIPERSFTRMSRKDFQAMRMYDAYWVFEGLSEASGSDYRDVDNTTDLEKVASIAANGDISHPLNNRKNILKFFKFYKEKYGITNRAQFLVRWNWVYPPKLERDLEETILLAEERNRQTGNGLCVRTQLLELRDSIKWAYDNTYKKELVASRQMWEFLSERVQVSYELYLLSVHKFLTSMFSESESRKFVYLPQPDAKDVGFAIKRLRVLLDLAAIGAIVGQSTLSTFECYQYLGRPFRVRGKQGLAVTDKESELAEYRSVVTAYLKNVAREELACHPLPRVRIMKDLVVLAREYGDKFQREKVKRSAEDFKDFKDQENFVAIFHAICCSKPGFEAKEGDMRDVFVQLVGAGLIDMDDKRKEEYWEREFARHMRQQSRKDVMLYMFGTKDEYETVMKFLDDCQLNTNA